MGNWVVIVQYDNDTYRTEFIRRGLETKEQALEELRAAVHTYVPSKHVVEQWRQVYRFADQESYLVVIKGRLTKWECTLRVAELVSDTNDAAVTGRAQAEGGTADEGAVDDGAVNDGAVDDGAVEVADEPQDRIPPGY
ncbi:hypothetical protein QF035_007448 [Streptomyces umbrinus]|uniref:Uncharacterized protein n=1 Tax=Streptomyces umbrinus TaxID=67370 RepID=A0ABU0T248_9ACTN|nr:hypothetical protein [Streptomyces umbrinus]MDQ1029866.1 hypothetical protein [Streptomyces umbrinus]